MKAAWFLVLGLGVGFAVGACNFDQGIQDYCSTTGSCACDGSYCCASTGYPCDNTYVCCGGQACVNGLCAAPPVDGGDDAGVDAGDAGCIAAGVACSFGACCGQCNADAGMCCSLTGQSCLHQTDCCDPNATCQGQCMPASDGG